MHDATTPGSAARWMMALLALSATAATGFASPFTPGNLLITANQNLLEYTRSGSLVQQIPIPLPGTPVLDHARDLALDPSGRLHVFNGTFDPFLSSYDPVAGTWEHHTFDGWSTINNITYGGIGCVPGYAFVTDQATFGPGELPSGLVRFDLTDYSAVRFADGGDYIDLTIGQDGLVYALRPSGSPGGTHVDVYEPLSMAFIRTVSLPSSQGLRGVAVDGLGRIFAVGFDGTIYRFTSTGVVETSRTVQALVGIFDNLSDIDIDVGGALAIGTRFGSVVLTNAALDPSQSSAFFIGMTFTTFVTFVPSGPVPVARTSWGRLKATYR